MKNFYKRLKEGYFSGPDWIIMPEFIKRGNYRSPTLMCILWIYAWHLRIFTIPGRIIIPVEFLVISYSFLLLQNQIKFLAFGLLSIIISDFLIGFLFRPKKISVRRFLPEKVFSGQRFEVLYEVKNEGKLPTWNLTIDPMPFFSFKGENPMIYTIPCLMPGEEKKVTAFRTAQRRGVFEIYRPLIETTFPFSIFKWTKQTGKREKIIIHPNFEFISEISLTPGQNYQIEGNAQIAKTGDSTDFIGCREFRTGDNPRHIHWPSSARRGDFVVKE
ncbi:MAG TPA: DUF58 domain-containing protein, partial [Victivallales bacterium]|nr:DUF58 domain-containing protein [Victivallales bacterium]